MVDTALAVDKTVATTTRRAEPSSRLGMVTAVMLLIYYGIVFVIPFGVAIWLSFQNWDFIDNHVFVGFDNYVRALRDPYFWKALKLTVLFSAVELVVTIPLALSVAYLLSKLKGFPQRFLLAIYYLPVMIPTIVTVLLWQLLYLPGGGLFNGILSDLGLPQQLFLQSPGQALWSVTAMIIWAELGGGIVLFLAGITTIPAQLLEAAQLDGAGLWRQFRHIVIPFLQPIIFYEVVVSIIALVQMFTQFQLLPGPGFSTRTLAVYSYELGFQSDDLGLGAAVSVFIFILLFAATLAQLLRYKSIWED